MMDKTLSPVDAQLLAMVLRGAAKEMEDIAKGDDPNPRVLNKRMIARAVLSLLKFMEGRQGTKAREPGTVLFSAEVWADLTLNRPVPSQKLDATPVAG